MNRLFLLSFYLLWVLPPAAAYSLMKIEPRIWVAAEELVGKNSGLSLDLKNVALAGWLEEALEKDFSGFRPFHQRELEKALDSDSRLVCFRIRNRKLFVDASPHWLRPKHLKVHALCQAIYCLMEQEDYDIDNCDFLVLMRDGANGLRSHLPIFCLARNHLSNFVLVPDYFSLSSNKRRLIEEIKQADVDVPWESKKNSAFWRGGAHGSRLNSPNAWRTNPRASLVLFSQERPDLVRAHFYLGCMKRACPELKSLKHILAAPWLTPWDSCHYKYLIDVDGWSCGYHRCQWILWSNCVPLKQTSSNVQWYYSGLKPYVHYVPYASDCSDLAEKIQWLRENDSKALEIAREGRRFCEENLTLEQCHLYLYRVLKKYHALYSKKN
jgi:Glycosyl transferase family 90